MKKILNVSEMKQVRGGAQISSFCGDGEKLYSCTTTYDNGFESTGVVCSSSAFSAGTAVFTQRTTEGATGIKTVSCA